MNLNFRQAPRITVVCTGLLGLLLALQSCADTQGTTLIPERDSAAASADVNAPPAPGSTLTTLVLSPTSASLHKTAGLQFTLSATWSDGSNSLPAVTYTATGGTISATGKYVAGTTAGTFRVIVTQAGGSKADTSIVAITSLVKLDLTPANANLKSGATLQFKAMGTRSDGSVDPDDVLYTATGGTITPAGLYTAGSTTGTYRVIAVHKGGSMADTSTVTVSGTATSLVRVILTPASTSLAIGATRQFTVSGKMSDSSTVTPAVTYTATGGTIAPGGLYTAGGTAGAFRVIAVQQGGTLADTAAVTITGTTTGATLFTEDFESTAFSSRNWYDQITIPTSTVEHTAGSTRSMMWHWGVGTVNPLAVAAARHKFTPSNSIYISYWVKFSSNFVGSGKGYHPHEFTILTTESPDYAGLAHTPLTLLLETTWQGTNGVPRLESADGSNVNLSHGAVPNDLTAITEARSASGCNGNPDGLNIACYNSGGSSWDNTKLKDAASAQFLSAAGPKYKGDWHHVEAYFKLNSIAGGIGQLDGIMQYWYDGTLVIDQRAVQFRTGAHPTMLLSQFVASPYIGDGSPVDQTEWIDDLVVRTSKP